MAPKEAPRASPLKACWCGSTQLDVYSSDYSRCSVCGTLVSRLPTPSDLAQNDDEHGLYGESYWYSHQEQNLQQPTIVVRARDDLTRRCLWWLRTLLKYRRPPARVLELGSAHGGFVALLRHAGFDATGLELSPAIVRFARQTFDVPMLQGPLDQQALQGISFDVIVLMDVLEHLEDPIQTLKECLDVLAPGGLLLVQTPSLPKDASYEDLTNRDDPFLRMLMPEEHRYIFSQSSLEKFFNRLGASHLVFEPPVFPLYDMFAVVSRMALAAIPAETATSALEARPTSRLVLALLDLEDRERKLLQRLDSATVDLAARDRQLGDALHWFSEANADRSARLAQVNTLVSALEKSESDREARGGQIDQLIQTLRESEADREARWDQIQSLTEALLESEADRRERWKQIEILSKTLEESETDRHARWTQIEALTLALRESEVDRQNLRQQITQTEAETTEARRVIDDLRGQRDQATARLRAANKDGQVLQAELSEVRENLGTELVRASHLSETLNEWEAAFRQLQSERQQTEIALRALRQSRWYRLLVRTGRWGSLDTVLSKVLGSNEETLPAPPGLPDLSDEHDNRFGRVLRLVAVDLTPVLPGGANGGAKIFALSLVRELAALIPTCKFVLLTSTAAHAELAALDAENVRRVCVSQGPATPSLGGQNSLLQFSEIARRFIPERLRSKLRQMLIRSKQRISGGLLESMGVDVLLCPFTAPYHYEPDIPCVSIVYDLQHRTYPEFFSSRERAERDQTFLSACRWADRLVCISSYVRDTVLAQGATAPDRVSVVHLRAIQHDSHGDAGANALETLGLVPERYLLYPANFWRHKNHEMLLLAMAAFRARYPLSDLKLVCTGAPGARLEVLRETANRMGLGSSVLFAGYVTDETYCQLLRRCRGLVFPSLYEGFGIPPIEAMAVGRPVACSRTTSLPEVTGGAALLFDPRKPDTIVEAIERLEFDEELRQELIAQGLQRAESLGTMHTLAEEYLQILESVLGAPRHYRDGITGLYDDGWTQGRLVVTYAAVSVSRRVELELEAPGWAPVPYVTVELRGADIEEAQYRIRRGERQTLIVALPTRSGYFELIITPLARPIAFGVGTDERLLGCFCRSCRFVSRDIATELLARTA